MATLIASRRNRLVVRMLSEIDVALPLEPDHTRPGRKVGRFASRSPSEARSSAGLIGRSRSERRHRAHLQKPARLIVPRRAKRDLSPRSLTYSCRKVSSKSRSTIRMRVGRSEKATRLRRNDTNCVRMIPPLRLAGARVVHGDLLNPSRRAYATCGARRHWRPSWYNPLAHRP